MEFSFTDEQKMIQETANSFLKEVSDSSSIRSAMQSESGYNKDTWVRLCNEMYWQAIIIPEEYDGLGLGYVELAIVLEQMGKHLLCSPFFSTVCFGVNALLIAGSDDQKKQYLSKISCGELTATLVHPPAFSTRNAPRVGAVVEKKGDEYVINGSCRYVIDGHTSDLLIVAALTFDSSNQEGITLFALPSHTANIKRTWLPSMDQTRKQAQIEFDKVVVSAECLMGEYGNAESDLDKIIRLSAIALSAEQVGGSQRVLDLTVEYTKERVQFGRPIAGFQAVKHQAADMMQRTEVSRSACYYAACIAQEFLDGGPLSSELSEAASVAKAYCSDSFFKNAGDAIQLHGGVGFTWEYDVHLYFKRAKSSQILLGNSEYHQEEIAKLLLD